jgi:hypothetical protein
MESAGVAELADAQDLKSWVAQAACGFNSRPRHTHNIDKYGHYSVFHHRVAVRPEQSVESWNHKEHEDHKGCCRNLRRCPGYQLV